MDLYIICAGCWIYFCVSPSNTPWVYSLLIIWLFWGILLHWRLGETFVFLKRLFLASGRLSAILLLCPWFPFLPSFVTFKLSFSCRLDSLWSCTYKVQTENGFPLRFFRWSELYFLARLAPSLSWWKKGRPLFHSPSACHWHREHSGALALVLGSSVGFTPWAVVEAVETSLRSFLYWNVKTVCVEWDFSGYGGHVLVPAVHLCSQSRDQAWLGLEYQVVCWCACVLLWAKFHTSLIPVRESAERGNHQGDRQ